MACLGTCPQWLFLCNHPTRGIKWLVRDGFSKKWHSRHWGRDAIHCQCAHEPCHAMRFLLTPWSGMGDHISQCGPWRGCAGIIRAHPHGPGVPGALLCVCCSRSRRMRVDAQAIATPRRSGRAPWAIPDAQAACRRGRAAVVVFELA